MVVRKSPCLLPLLALLLALTPSAVGRAATQRVAPERIEGVVRAAVQRQMPWEPGKTAIEIHLPQRPVPVPAGTISLRAAFRPGETFLGLTPTEVTIAVDGREAQRLWITTEVRPRATVAVAHVDLHRGAPVRPEMVEEREVDLSTVPADTIRSLKDVLGMRTRRLIKAGEVLTGAAVEQPPIAKRGDTVTMVVAAQGLQASTKGVLLEAGRRGERVRVKNLSSGATVYGRLSDATTVVVDF